MGLSYEMALYTELTGEDGTKVPIGQLGHFLWGYEIGIEKGRTTGKWEHEFHSYEDGLGWRWKCSMCGCVAEDIREMNYCPRCGAHMKGVR